MKDLLVPFSEQRSRMKQGGRYLVYTYLDDTTKRIVASSKIEKFLGNTIPLYAKGTKVHCLICDENDIGYKVIVENLHKGIIYKNQVYKNLEIGDEIDGFVKQIRDDNKIDVTINDIAINRIDELAKRFHNFISINGGSTSLGDKSSPEEIKAIMSCSKKDLKKAIGLLYKQHLITINNGIITLNQK